MQNEYAGWSFICISTDLALVFLFEWWNNLLPPAAMESYFSQVSAEDMCWMAGVCSSLIFLAQMYVKPLFVFIVIKVLL